MSREITLTVYKFTELCDEAKERARAWWRERALEYNWWDAVYEDAARIADMLGIDLRQKPVKLVNGKTRFDPAIYFSGFYSQGDGACFEGSYAYKRGCVKAIKKYAPQDKELHRIADNLCEIQKRNNYKITATIDHSGRYSHSGTMSIYIDSFVNDVDAADIKQSLRDFADWIYDALRREYEYQLSDECVDESIIVNEYEFDSEGSIA